MSTYRLFPSTGGPSTPVSYSGPFLAGIVFEVTSGGMWLDGFWWWVCDSGQSTSPQTFALWQVHNNTGAGNIIAGATATSGTLVAGEWNYVELASPVPLAIGACYIACTGFSGSFPDTNGQFGPGGPYSAGIVNGPLTAFSDQPASLPAPFSLSQGVFSTAGTDPTANMPVEGSSSSNFWMDVEVDTEAPTGASYRLWPNYPMISGTISNDTGQQTTATEFWLSQDCTVENIWFYSAPGVGGLPTACAIWDVATKSPVAGSEQTSPSWSGSAGSGWVACAYNGLELAAGKYKVGIYYSGGDTFYQENTHYFSSPQGDEEDIASSLVPNAWWELADASGSTTAEDSSGNDYVGTVHGGVAFGQLGPLLPGTAAWFDGSTGYVSSTLNFSSSWTGLSLAAWVRIPSGSAQPSGVVGSSNMTSGGGASLQVAPDGGMLAVQPNLLTAGETFSGSFVSGIAWGDDLWHFIAVTWDGSTLVAYLDGAAIGTPEVLTGSLAPGSTDVAIGLAGGAYMLGALAHCMIFNSALSAVDVAQLYHPSLFVPGPGADGVTSGPLSSPNITNAAGCVGNSTGAPMTGNSTYQNGTFAYPETYDVNDGGENRWIDIEVVPASPTGGRPPANPLNSGAFLVFFP